jgi:hypothetical protein
VFGSVNICAYAVKLVNIAEKSRNKMIVVTPTTAQTENDMDRYDLILIGMIVIITLPYDKNKMNADRSRKLRYVRV